MIVYGALHSVAVLWYLISHRDIIIFCPPAQSRGHENDRMLHNGCNDFLFGVHCVEEGDRIPPLQSYGQALKQKDCFSGILSDDCGASANLLD